MTMYEHFNQLPLPLLTLCAGDSPANPTASPESGLLVQTSGIFGQSSPALLARLDRGGSWQRMYRGCCPVKEGDTSGESSQTWPRSGSMQNGSCYRLRPSGLPIGGIGYSLWPTPTVNDANNATFPPSQVSRDSLVGAVMRAWPTPRSSDWKGAVTPTDCTARRLATGRANLPEAVQEQERDQGGGTLSPMWVEWLMGFPTGWTDLDV